MTIRQFHLTRGHHVGGGSGTVPPGSGYSPGHSNAAAAAAVSGEADPGPNA